MSWDPLMTAIKKKLDAIGALQVVYDTPHMPDQFPAATISPSEAPSDYETSQENKRLYTFFVMIFYETKNAGKEKAVKALYSLVDTVVDAFDRDPQLSAVGLTFTDPTRYLMIDIKPAPSAWDFTRESEYVAASIKLTAIVSVDVS